MTKKKESNEFLHIIKWDVTIDKNLPIPKGETNLAASFVGPFIIIRKDVYLNSIFDLYGKEFLMDALKYLVLEYCKHKKVKCNGEILAYSTKDEYDHKFSKQVKIKISPSKVEYSPCKINIIVSSK